MVKTLKAHVIFVSNPFEPLKDTEVCELLLDKGQSYSIRSWLLAKFPNFTEFTKPTVCLLNGKPLMRKQWGKKIRPGDIVNFVTVAGTDPLTWLYIIYGVFVVAAIAISLSVKIPTANLTGDTPGADPVYTLRGQRNQIRLGQPIEVPYGRCRLWPSYAAQSYNQYIDNNQWLYQLFCLGQGSYTIHDINIEDTPIADFSDVQWEVIAPGDDVTLFPTNVVTVAEVGGIELLGPNEGGAGSYVIDSEGDPAADPPIPETGHYNAALAGPFVVNPSGTQTNRIEVDIQLPRGLYVQADDGTLGSLAIAALFEVQEIDGAGSPIGSWATLSNWTVTHDTITPQRYTVGADVTLGRYRIRASRTTNKNTSAKAGNVLIWESARAFIPEDMVDDGITRLAVKARASNNLNDNSASRINVVATRHLHYWDPALNGGLGDWSATAEPTRSVVWAFCDAFRAQYGARLANQYLDLNALAALDLTLEDRSEYFDWVFEQRTTVWDVARTIAAVARAVPMLNGSRVSMIRDDVKTFPVAVFNPENIVKDSFKWGIKLAELNPYDGLVLTYTNGETWKEETVLCLLDDESGNNPDRKKIVGITGREHAYHLGMYMRAFDRYVRESFEWRTGLEGHIPSYNDMVAASHDVPRWDAGGIVLAMVKEFTGGVWQYRLDLSEPYEDFTAGARALMLRDKAGAAIGPFIIGPVEDTNNRRVFYNNATEDDDLDALVFNDVSERPLYLFGTPEAIGKHIVVTKLAGSEDQQVAVEGRPYDERLFAKDDATPPAPGETHGNLPAVIALPAVSGLRVVSAPINTIDGGVGVVASWFPMPGAVRYLIHFSYDAKNWEEVGETKELSISFPVSNRYLYIRVAAINTARGDWAYWTGQAPIQDTTTCQPPTGLTLQSGTSFGLLMEDGTFIARIKATWTVPPDELVKAQGFIRLQYKLSADPDIAASWVDWGTVQGSQTFDFIGGVRPGTAYNVRIRSENKFGGVSTWATPAGGSHTVAGDSTTPAAVPNTVVATAYPGYIEITFARSATPQVNEYKFYRHTSNSPGSATLIGEDDSLIFADSGTVGGLTPGTLYYYWVVPVSGSNVNGPAQSTPATATALAPSFTAAIPSNPTAPTVVGGTIFADHTGKIVASATVRLQALPSNAVWQNVLLRVNGGTSDWQLFSQARNTGANYDVRIDDLSPGINYDLALQAWSAAGGSSIIPLAGSGYFTAATKATASANATSVVLHAPSSSYACVPEYYPGSGLMFSCIATFVASTDKDIINYEFGFSTDTGTAPSVVNARVSGSQNRVQLSTQFLSAQYVWTRCTNSSGVTSSWVYTGYNMNSYATFPAGNMSVQNSSNVNVTKIKSGAGSVNSVVTRHPYIAGISISGGSTSETLNLDISSRGFTTAPDVGNFQLTNVSAAEARYDWDDSTSTNAVFRLRTFDGTNLPSFIILSGEFVEYD